MKYRGINSGFTLTEVIVVIALMAVLFAMALPPFMTWRENLNFRQVARGIGGALGTARSQAISTNRQHRLEINAVGRSYRLLRGNRSHGFTNWSAGSNSPSFPPGVVLDLGGAAILNVDYFPNGTSPSGGTIGVTDGSSTRYRIQVEPTGRIRTEKLK